ncbi:two-component system nitrogen regulation response regulator GlnG [Idiomarina aquatica]|uniref:DNA-binding transcriptional regulator NtrC n=1 Tax=Idiomarina aquatica TaxID=1327752 RepID=A0A4R6P3H3_9GAMM|nr:nitrogen regulation protein NR(I) [Idiomarina aquatica]TDP32117.1 two-component system nitrogen regulation response regulator GlnG [Idiomarina aquatica]
MTTAKLWVIDDDPSIRWVLEKTFNDTEFQVRCFNETEQVYKAFAEDAPDVLLSDIRMPGDDGLTLLKKMTRERPDLPVVIMTAHSDLDTAVNVFKGGAFEYLAKPFDLDDAVATVRKAYQQRQSQPQLTEVRRTPPTLIGDSASMQDVFRVIGRLSKSSVSVLITGETGTGKELIANALHQHSPRAEHAFVALNMAAIPAELIESELFGHEKGAFTGADKRRVGRFEQANHGTLFLDEIGDMPLPVQTRLLRVLAEGQFYPVGAHQPLNVDVRVIAATHKNLEQAVTRGEFREDLFHRLNVIQLKLPALRERTEDIPQLADYFLQRSAQELAVNTKQLSDDAVAALCRYNWPGNVRQLENVCRWLTVMAPGQAVQTHELPDELQQKNEPDVSLEVNEAASWGDTIDAELRRRVHQHDVLTALNEELERRALRFALERFGGHKQKAARWLGWGRNTLTRKTKLLLK